MKIYRACKKYLKTQRKLLVCYTITAMVIKLLGIMSPYVMGGFIDGLVTSSNINYVYRFCLILGALQLSVMGLGYILTMLYSKMQLLMGSQYNLDVLSHVQKLPLDKLHAMNLAELNQQINQDTNALIIFCLSILSDFISNFIMLIVLFWLCATMNLHITILVAICCILYILAYNKTKQVKYNVSYDMLQSQNVFFAALFEQLTYIEFIRTHGIEKVFAKRLHTPYNDLFDKTLKNKKYSYILDAIDSFLSVLAQVILYVIGAQQILSGSFSVGDFVAFSVYITMIISSVRYFYRFGSSFQEVMVSYKRIERLISMPEEREGEIFLDKVQDISIRNLNISYGSVNVFGNLNAHISQGKIIGIVGNNGCGKSTLICAILGLLNDKIQDNAICLNGYKINEVNKHHLRHDLIGFVEQDIVVFPGSLRENILLDLTDYEAVQKMHELSRMFSIDYLAEKEILPDTLSGGEKQKIAIVRSLVKKTSLIIMDEPTSALDSGSKENLLNYLLGIRKDHCIVIITHDKSIIENCDEIIAL